MEENYAIPAEPQYREDIRKLQDSDPASASRVFNPLFARIIENIASVKRLADTTGAAASSIAGLDLTIPAAGWVPSPGEPGEPEELCVDIPAEIIQEDMIPILVVLPACLGTAGDCGLKRRADPEWGAAGIRQAGAEVGYGGGAAAGAAVRELWRRQGGRGWGDQGDAGRGAWKGGVSLWHTDRQTLRA